MEDIMTPAEFRRLMGFTEDPGQITINAEDLGDFRDLEAEVERLLAARIAQEDQKAQKVEAGATRRRGKIKDAAVTRLVLNIVAAGLPEPIREYKFHPTRKWRADLAWPRHGLLMEIDGGIWLQTRTGRSKGHGHPVRFIQDIEKLSEAAILGYRVIRATPAQVRNGEAIDRVDRYMKAYREKRGGVWTP